MNSNYQVVNGISYHAETLPAVINALESARISRTRVRLYYGDTKTGRAWLEEHDVYGRIGRSTGTSKIPLIVNNSRCLGGPGILDHCIVRIIDSKTHCVFYSHPSFHTGVFVIREGSMNTHPYEVFEDDSLVARFRTGKQAKKYVVAMRGFL